MAESSACVPAACDGWQIVSRLPRDVATQIVSRLSEKTRTALRATCRLANQLVDCGVRSLVICDVYSHELVSVRLRKFEHLQHLSFKDGADGKTKSYYDTDLAELLVREANSLQRLQSLNLASCAYLSLSSILPLALFYTSNLASLSINCISFADPSACMAVVGKLTSLTSLSMSDLHGVTEQEMTHLYSLSKLQSLHLCSCHRMTDSLLLVLAGACPLLQSLALEKMHMLSGEGLHHCTGLHHLTSLSLSGCAYLTDAGMLHVSQLTRLQVLDLSHMRQGQMSRRIHAALSDISTCLGGLRALHLRDWRLQDQSLQVLHLPHLTALSVGSIHYTHHTSLPHTEQQQQAGAIAPGPPLLPALLQLQLSSWSRGPPSSLLPLPSLQSLSIGSGLGPEAARCIAVQTQLTELRLGDLVQWGDAELELILKRLVHLRSLHLKRAYDKMTECCLVPISHLTQLQHLALSHFIFLTDFSLLPVLRLARTLQTIMLACCDDVSAMSVGALLSGLPHLTHLSIMGCPRITESVTSRALRICPDSCVDLHLVEDLGEGGYWSAGEGAGASDSGSYVSGSDGEDGISTASHDTGEASLAGSDVEQALFWEHALDALVDDVDLDVVMHGGPAAAVAASSSGSSLGEPLPAQPSGSTLYNDVHEVEHEGEGEEEYLPDYWFDVEAVPSIGAQPSASNPGPQQQQQQPRDNVHLQQAQRQQQQQQGQQSGEDADLEELMLQHELRVLQLEQQWEQMQRQAQEARQVRQQVLELPLLPTRQQQQQARQQQARQQEQAEPAVVPQYVEPRAVSALPSSPSMQDKLPAVSRILAQCPYLQSLGVNSDASVRRLGTGQAVVGDGSPGTTGSSSSASAGVRDHQAQDLLSGLFLERRGECIPEAATAVDSIWQDLYGGMLLPIPPCHAGGGAQRVHAGGEPGRGSAGASASSSAAASAGAYGSTWRPAGDTLSHPCIRPSEQAGSDLGQDEGAVPVQEVLAAQDSNIRSSPPAVSGSVPANATAL